MGRTRFGNRYIERLAENLPAQQPLVESLLVFLPRQFGVLKGGEKDPPDNVSVDLRQIEMIAQVVNLFFKALRAED